LRIEYKGKTRTVKLNATAEIDQLGEADLIIIFVKSTQTADAAKTAQAIIESNCPVLTLQNGMGNADIIAETIGAKCVVAGTTSHGATLLGPGSIRHAGVGPTVIGMWERGNPTQTHTIAKAFNEAGIQTEVVEDVRSVVWDKLLVNVGINAITALTGIKNGQILDLVLTKKLSQAAVEEAMAVARAQGVNVRDDAVQHVLTVAKATGPNRSSMGQDVDNRRQTEIGAINGVVVREGRKCGLETPVNQTLTALIETLQDHYK
jgi:2-dehydropantoate 2-reductase